MIENLQSFNVFSPSYFEIFFSLLVSLICSYTVSVIYKYTYRGPGYSLSFVNSNIFLSLITTLVIMGIGNNLARAFGLVGALSIIRFRTAIKDTSDLVYIFLSLAVGMSAGIGYFKLTFTGTIVIGIVLIIFSKTGSNLINSSHYLLQFSSSDGNSNDSNIVVKLLSGYCSDFEIMSIRTDEINNSLIYSYNISMKNISNADKMILELKNEGLRNVNLFFDQQKV